MQRTLIVSNRLPLILKKSEGKVLVEPSVGGLATGLASFYQSHNCIWIGWPGILTSDLDDTETREISAILAKKSCHPVYISRSEIEDYYMGFCNSTIWPLFHYFQSESTWEKPYWDAYLSVNRQFCNAITELYRPGDRIWIHDYHLMLLPAMIREKIPDASIGFFNHIPFPSYEIYRILPWRKEILEGLMGADLIGFHSYNYVRYFIDSVRHILGYQHTSGEILTEDHLVKVDTFPMGIDYEHFAGAVDRPEVQREIQRIRSKYGNRHILLSFDRLDYTKGIPQRLKAFDLFLEHYPEYKGNVILMVIAVPSRTSVKEYSNIKRQIDRLVGNITGRHGTMDWMPVRYFYDILPFETLVALYKVADVALVTPLRDGMNLMAKEFIATKTDGKGVLILSEMAGAAAELGEALIVNPFNLEEMAETLHLALTMPEEEMIRRNRWMQSRLRRYNIMRWTGDFIQRLETTKEDQNKLNARRISDALRDELINKYRTSKDRLIFLDYDGTLVNFTPKPEAAIPDAELLSTLRALAEVSTNELVIVSGRDRGTLNNWFGIPGISIIAEHGIWIRRREGAWEMTESLQNDWKSDIKPILELYVDRTPGSFIEEKDYSLVWHYRMAESELAKTRAMELKSILFDLTAHKGLTILEGSNVLEIKNAGYNKGRAAMEWLHSGKWDFIMAVGDDQTDEYLFDVLPEDAYSIKVGMIQSKAHYNLNSVRQVRELLSQCAGCKGEDNIQNIFREGGR